MEETAEKLITKIVETRLKAISKKVDTLQTTLDRAIAQLDDDRKEISDLKVAMGKNLAVSEGTRDDLHDQTKKVVDKVQENLQPVPDMVTEAVKDEINKVKKKKWFNIFKKGGE